MTHRTAGAPALAEQDSDSQVGSARRPVEAGPGVRVHTRADRDLAVRHWLQAGLREPSEAAQAWARGDVALLPLGVRFAAVRIPDRMAYAAAASKEPAEVAEFLAQVLDDGPVICDPRHCRYYVLVPASCAVRWDHAEAECLGRGWHLGVPRVDAVGPDVPWWGSYWAVPMPSAGVLCDPDLVAELVVHGGRILAAQAEEAR